MPLPRERAHIVGEDEILEIARRAELHAWHDVVELEAELRETRLANQHNAPPRIKSAMISRGTCGIEAFFSCSPVRSASLTASRLRNTATGCPIFSMAQANSSPVAPRQESPVVMWSKSGWFSGLAKAPVRSSCAWPGGTDAVSPPPRKRPSRKMTIRCMGVTSLQHVGSVGLLVLSPESAEGSMARPLTRSRGHRSIACKARGPRCAAAHAGEVCG